MDVSIRRFGELTTGELYDLLRLRSDVFVVEQQCVFLDPDGEDLAAVHVLGREGGRLVAYARVQETASGPRIARVVTDRAMRRRGLAHEIVRACLRVIGARPCYLLAQDHLRGFYAAHGFVAVGEVFLEDGLPHVRMGRG